MSPEGIGDNRIVGVPEKPIAATVVLTVLAAAILASAWLCDDAYITFRTVENFTSGDGLRWNVAERVQSYTHPLWMFAVAGLHLVSGEVYFTSLLLSFACTMLAAAILAFGIASSSRMALLALVPLVLSKAFVDFSTSGLENPLTHLLLALFFWSHSGPLRGSNREREHPLRLGLVTSLLALNRLDVLLLVAPTVLLALAAGGQQRLPSRLAAFALGGSLLVVWELFSLFYYGFPFPNTAYAKLMTGIPLGDLALQGLRYLADSLARDPLTLSLIAAGIGASFLGPASLRPRRLAMAAGIGLYLLYIVRIGGDFMAGRLLTPPLFCAAILICQTQAISRGVFRAAMAVAVALAVAVGAPTLLTGPGYGVAEDEVVRSGSSPRSEHGIADERAVYYPHTGLLRRWLGLARVEGHPWAQRGQDLRDAGGSWAQGQALGFYAFFAGPRVHVLDMVGLSDPLLARIDARRLWRIGHFERKLPRGYVDTLRSGTNRIADRDLASYYGALSRVVRDPLFDVERLGVIARFNLGGYDALLEGYRRRQIDAK